MLEQVRAVDGVHFSAEAHLARTKLLVHVVQSVSHCVHRIDDELHLPFLLVVGVLPDPLLICNGHGHVRHMVITAQIVPIDYMQSNTASAVTRLAKQSARSLICIWGG